MSQAPICKRLGRFHIPAELVMDMHPAVTRIMGMCTILRAEHNLASNAVEYQALCFKFEPVEHGRIMPEYQWVFHEDGSVDAQLVPAWEIGSPLQAPAEGGYHVVRGGQLVAWHEGDVAGGSWVPPELFNEPWARSNQRTMTLLYLCGGHSVPASAVEAWSDAECQAAEDWAMRQHLHASDNYDVVRVPVPACVAAHPYVPGAEPADLWIR